MYPGHLRNRNCPSSYISLSALATTYWHYPGLGVQGRSSDLWSVLLGPAPPIVPGLIDSLSSAAHMLLGTLALAVLCSLVGSCIRCRTITRREKSSGTTLYPTWVYYDHCGRSFHEQWWDKCSKIHPLVTELSSSANGPIRLSENVLPPRQLHTCVFPAVDLKRWFTLWLFPQSGGFGASPIFA